MATYANGGDDDVQSNEYTEVKPELRTIHKIIYLLKLIISDENSLLFPLFF